MVLISDAQTAWNLLKGVVCIYKPVGVKVHTLRKMFIGNLSRDLCELECRPPVNHVFIEGSTTAPLNVYAAPSYADHPLVVGPRYQPQDFRCNWGSPLGKNVSGVFLLGLNGGSRTVINMHTQRTMRGFRVKGLLGKASENYFISGKVMEKATFDHITRIKLDEIVRSMLIVHQKQMVTQSGVDKQSQTSTNLVKQGIIKPTNSKVPILYSMKIKNNQIDRWIIEVQCINENEMYLRELIHAIGMKARSCATCTGIQCIRYDFFTLEHALLRKHWQLQYILQNMAQCQQLLEKTAKRERQKLPTFKLYEEMAASN
ncbi:hypothetical protein L9F63_008557 [Diploptera punctata]|uniref:Pseudouridine synthase II N-terminal domain-containing protein n=1 Tax=Diploptera punctata TaxID=6984 RepID=A0AAD8E203_DIPPU|nr:hypothetical protein L9F63_008557 [Diploptera punctata]